MWSYGASHEGPRSLPPGVREQAARIATLKGKAAARGDLRAVRHYDLQLKQLMLQHGIVHGETFGEVVPPLLAHQRMTEARVDRVQALDRHRVPPWFRPGYDDKLRLRLWLRLSKKFRVYLADQNQKGRLSVYLPAPSYWAKTIKPSRFYVPVAATEIEAVLAQSGIGEEVVGEGPSTASEAQAAAQAFEQQAAEVADLQQELAAEALEGEALAQTLEAPGAGKLASEEVWYEDPGKVFLAVVGGLVVLSAVQR